MNTEKEAAFVSVSKGGWAHVDKLRSFAREWEAAGREVDVVEISADSRGGSMSAVVDGVVIFAEVHGE